MTNPEVPPPVVTVAGHSLLPGSRTEFELRPAKLPSGGWMAIPVVAFRGRQDGPTVWISSAIHGDEVGGVEIVRQVLGHLDPNEMAGTLLAVPVVNVPGFAVGDRYMPDRRDLNRCFPGSPRGSLASRFAHKFMSEIVESCDLGIDLHTGSDHRQNHPQIRGNFRDPKIRELADVFAAPCSLDAKLRTGSLREAASRIRVPSLLFEAGEAWRFDDYAITVGVSGILRTLAHVGMIKPLREPAPEPTEYLDNARWVRSPSSGVARMMVELGQSVSSSDVIAMVSDASGSNTRLVKAKVEGMVIGRNVMPIVHRGDALVNIGRRVPATVPPQ